MTSPKDDGQAHQISVTRPVFEYLGKILRTTISFPLSTRVTLIENFASHATVQEFVDVKPD